MTEESKKLADLVVAAYLEENTIKQSSNAFKKRKGIPINGSQSAYNRLTEIIDFFNKNAPPKTRLTLTHINGNVEKAKTPSHTVSSSSDDSSDDEQELFKKASNHNKSSQPYINSTRWTSKTCNLQNASSNEWKRN